MCFSLVKTSSEIYHSSYGLKVACYLYSVFVRSIIYHMFVYELILRGIAFKIHESKGASSGEVHLYLTQDGLPSVPTHTLNKYLLNE